MVASVDLLEQIHQLFAEQIIEEINQYKAEGIPIPAADKAVYAKFLRDNSVFCVPKSNEDLMDLREELMNGNRDQAIAKLKSEISGVLENEDY